MLASGASLAKHYQIKSIENYLSALIFFQFYKENNVIKRRTNQICSVYHNASLFNQLYCLNN